MQPVRQLWCAVHADANSARVRRQQGGAGALCALGRAQARAPRRAYVCRVPAAGGHADGADHGGRRPGAARDRRFPAHAGQGAAFSRWYVELCLTPIFGIPAAPRGYGGGAVAW